MVWIMALRSSSDMSAAASTCSLVGPGAGGVSAAASSLFACSIAWAVAACQGESGGNAASMACQAAFASAVLPSWASAVAR